MSFKIKIFRSFSISLTFVNYTLCNKAVKRLQQKKISDFQSFIKYVKEIV